MPHLALVLTVAVTPPPAGGAFAPPGSHNDDCWVAPLQVSLSELAMINQISDEYVSNHCARFLRGSFERYPGRAMTVAETRIADFELFGERLSFGFDVVVRPGGIGRNDTIYTAPALDLPDSWERAIDKATYPALAIAGTAVITAIIVNVLK